jgi:hypothetical protein
MRECCLDVVRQRRGYCAEIVQDISPDTACPVCGHLAEIVWTFAWNSADTVRILRDLRPYHQVRGWCLTKMTGFPFQKAAADFVRLNVSQFVPNELITKH